MPILRAVSTADPTVYISRVKEESREREASAEYRPEQSSHEVSILAKFI